MEGVVLWEGKMTDIKVLSAKKIFHLGFYYSWHLWVKISKDATVKLSK